jgi:hypothetical protein
MSLTSSTEEVDHEETFELWAPAVLDGWMVRDSGSHKRTGEMTLPKGLVILQFLKESENKRRGQR